MVFFCTNLGNGPAGTQACPNLGAATATVTGTFTNASVVAIPTQNVTAGEFDALVDALRSNTAYANIHTSAFPAGEIRGQIHRVRGDHDDKEHEEKDHGRYVDTRPLGALVRPQWLIPNTAPFGPTRTLPP